MYFVETIIYTVVQDFQTEVTIISYPSVAKKLIYVTICGESILRGSKREKTILLQPNNLGKTGVFVEGGKGAKVFKKNLHW